MKEMKSYRIDSSVLEKLKIISDANKRTHTNMIEYLIILEYERILNLNSK